MFNKIKQKPFNTKLKSNYKIYRNLLTKIIKSAKNLFFFKEIIIAQGNTQKVWNLIKESINNKDNKKTITNVVSLIDEHNHHNIIHESKDIANKSNIFFTNIGENIAKKINLL